MCCTSGASGFFWWKWADFAPSLAAGSSKGSWEEPRRWGEARHPNSEPLSPEAAPAGRTVRRSFIRCFAYSCRAVLPLRGTGRGGAAPLPGRKFFIFRLPGEPAIGKRAGKAQPGDKIRLHLQNCIFRKYIPAKDNVAAHKCVRRTRTNCENFSGNLAKKGDAGRRVFVQSTEKRPASSQFFQKDFSFSFRHRDYNANQYKDVQTTPWKLLVLFIFILIYTVYLDR